jgi:hypothetical protein
MTLREKEVPKMGIAIGVCTQTWWWYPDLTGEQVTQKPGCNTVMLTAIAGASILSPTSRGVLSTRTVENDSGSGLLVSSVPAVRRRTSVLYRRSLRHAGGHPRAGHRYPRGPDRIAVGCPSATAYWDQVIRVGRVYRDLLVVVAATPLPRPRPSFTGHDGHSSSSRSLMGMTRIGGA